MSLTLINKELEVKRKLLTSLQAEVNSAENKAFDDLKSKWEKLEAEVREAVEAMVENDKGSTV